MDIVSSMRFQNASTNTRRYSSWKLPVVLSQMQAWNIDLRTTTEYICYQRARRSDAEPVTHEVLSPVVIGFFYPIHNDSLPRPTGKEKTVAGQVVFVRSTYISLRRFWEIKAAGSFCLSKRFIVRMAAIGGCTMRLIFYRSLNFESSKKALLPYRVSSAFTVYYTM